MEKTGTAPASAEYMTITYGAIYAMPMAIMMRAARCALLRKGIARAVNAKAVEKAIENWKRQKRQGR